MVCVIWLVLVKDITWIVFLVLDFAFAPAFSFKQLLSLLLCQSTLLLERQANIHKAEDWMTSLCVGVWSCMTDSWIHRISSAARLAFHPWFPDMEGRGSCLLSDILGHNCFASWSGMTLKKSLGGCPLTESPSLSTHISIFILFFPSIIIGTLMYVFKSNACKFLFAL